MCACSVILTTFFCLPTEFNLDLYSKDNIPDLLYFIPGETFHSQIIDNLPIEHFGFFLLHIVSAKVLVPVTNTKVLSFLQEGLPATPSAWNNLITDMKRFSKLLERYFSTIFLSTRSLSIHARP